MGKMKNILGNVSKVVNSDDPAKTAANIVGSAAQISHPIVGSILRPHIEKAVETGVNKGIEFVNDPNNQAKAKEVGGKVLNAGKNALGAVTSRMGEFFNGRNNAQSTSGSEPIAPTGNIWDDAPSTGNNGQFYESDNNSKPFGDSGNVW